MDFLKSILITYDKNIIDLLNPDPSIYENIQIENIGTNIPYDYKCITPDMQDYNDALNNFLSNENSSIPQNYKILIKNIWFYYGKNSHNKYSIYAYCSGFDELNKKGKYPLLTAPFQINTHKDCKKHNKKYNNKYYTQVTILNDINGESLPKNNKLTFSAYHGDTFFIAIKQIIYLLDNLYRLIKQEYDIEILTYNLMKIPELEMKKKNQVENKIRLILKKKYLKMFYNFKIYEESKKSTIKLNLNITI